MNTIFKIDYQSSGKSFTQISNEIIENPKLSWKAKGLALGFLKNQDGFFVYKTSLMSMSTDNRRSVDSGIEELKLNGYIDEIPATSEIKEIVRRPNLDCIYVFHEEPRKNLIEKWTTIYNSKEKKTKNQPVQNAKLQNASLDNSDDNIQSCKMNTLNSENATLTCTKCNVNMDKMQLQHVQNATLTCSKCTSNNTINNNINNNINNKKENKKNNNIYTKLLINFIGNDINKYNDNISDIDNNKLTIKDFFEFYYDEGEYKDFIDYIKTILKEYLGEYYFNKDKEHIEDILKDKLIIRNYFNMFCSKNESYDDFLEYCSNYNTSKDIPDSLKLTQQLSEHKEEEYEDTYSYLQSLNKKEKDTYDNLYNNDYLPKQYKNINIDEINALLAFIHPEDDKIEIIEKINDGKLTIEKYLITANQPYSEYEYRLQQIKDGNFDENDNGLPF